MEQRPHIDGGKFSYPLHQADKPWLPRHRCRGEEAEKGGDFTGKFRSILNKVTLQTLETLARQALGLKVESVSSLEAMVELLHTQVHAMYRGCDVHVAWVSQVEHKVEHRVQHQVGKCEVVLCMACSVLWACTVLT